MSDNNNKKDDKSPSKIDPAIEAKIDKMMTIEPEKPAASKIPGSTTSPSAPLLPGDKLPNFDEQPAKKSAEPITPHQLEAAKPAVAEPKTEPVKPLATQTLDDEKTNKAVDDIAQKESDRMLAIEDAKADLLAEGTAEIDKGFFNRIKSKIKNFWANKTARRAVLSCIVLAILAVAVVPASRYFVLNSIGVKASTSLRIIDEKTNQPLKNVEVSLSGKSEKTDKDGKVKLTNIKLGNQQLSIKKPAFAEVNQKVVIGWGSNPRGDIRLNAVGSRYTFNVKDFVSKKPAFAEAISGEASASSNENGEIVLVVADQDEITVPVQIVGENYRTEELTLDVGNKDVHQVELVPSKKHAFVSKRSGKYDLYKIDVDGKNEQKVLAGTGAEIEDRITILAHPISNKMAYVSNRGDQRNADGFALSTVAIVNLDDDKVEVIDSSERVQLVDFIGNKLVYVKIAEGESGASPTRHRLISYDVESGESKELASTNYFNDVLAAGKTIYYTPAPYQANGNVGLFKINADGTNKSTVYNQEAWNLFRVAYDKINVSVSQNWYEYNIPASSFNPLNGSAEGLKSRIYVDNQDGKKSAWVDERDGKGVLLIYGLDSREDKSLHTQSGLRNPIRWLDNDHIVYRASTGSETADYVISLSGGEPHKIIDVTNTAGLDRWYYY